MLFISSVAEGRRLSWPEYREEIRNLAKGTLDLQTLRLESMLVLLTVATIWLITGQLI